MTSNVPVANLGGGVALASNGMDPKVFRVAALRSLADDGVRVVCAPVIIGRWRVRVVVSRCRPAFRFSYDQTERASRTPTRDGVSGDAQHYLVERDADDKKKPFLLSCPDYDVRPPKSFCASGTAAGPHTPGVPAGGP
ncbi:Hypothetical protein CINCED_3A018242 [Cinara cedri]|uniref:Uncharacterized protein n=1 Tax=Cinara cedri TaxID=506608 RepID=A0A5E4NIF7_9HEMI|nr:Hypothetical protein CINCED_3A018242 [Cinara cedri]